MPETLRHGVLRVQRCLWGRVRVEPGHDVNRCMLADSFIPGRRLTLSPPAVPGPREPNGCRRASGRAYEATCRRHVVLSVPYLWESVFICVSLSNCRKRRGRVASATTGETQMNTD